MKQTLGVVLTTLAMTLTVTNSGHRHAHHHAALTPDALATGTVGTPYTQALQEHGGVGPYTWSLAKGSTLPVGLSLDPATGIISGSPLHPGKTTVTTAVVDSSNPGHKAIHTYLLGIEPQPLVLPSTLLANAPVHQTYAQKLVAVGGKPPYTWSVASGTLPDGIKLDPTTGILTGTPINAKSTEFTIQVRDSAAEQVVGWQRAVAWSKELIHHSDEPMAY